MKRERERERERAGDAAHLVAISKHWQDNELLTRIFLFSWEVKN